MIYAELGSVSSATMRLEDLVPTFYSLLAELAQKNDITLDLGFCRDLESRMDADDYYKLEDANYDLDELFDRLDKYAPPYCYFGAYPGDGADYGFWITEDLEQVFDGLRVYDLADVPLGYRGEVLYVNDHGNITLWLADDRKLTEIWSVG